MLVCTFLLKLVSISEILHQMGGVNPPKFSFSTLQLTKIGYMFTGCVNEPFNNSGGGSLK